VWHVAKQRLFTAQLVDGQLGCCSITHQDITIKLMQTDGYLTDYLTKKKNRNVLSINQSINSNTNNNIDNKL